MIPRAFSFGLGMLARFTPLGMGLVAGFVIFGFLDKLVGSCKKEADQFVKRTDSKADDFEAALKMAYADGKLDPKEEKLLDKMIGQSRQPSRLKKAKKKMAKLFAQYGDKLNDHQKLVDKYMHALIFGNDNASKLLKRLKKRLGDTKIGFIFDSRRTKLLVQFEQIELKKSKARVFDSFEIALTGIISDDVVNDSEISHLNEILANEKPSVDLPRQVPASPESKTKDAEIRLADYQGEVSVEPVRTVGPLNHLLELNKTTSKNIDKAEAIRTMYQAVAVDGKVNKAEIAELRKLMAA